MTVTPIVPSLDAAAKRDHARFGQVFLLSGLACAQLDCTALAEDHPMAPAWDSKGQRVYQCAKECRRHSVLVETADDSAWFAFCAATNTAPHEITDRRQQRELLVANVTHVWLTCYPDADPVTAISWGSFPAVNPT
ncbi:hypothetical protein [Stackebrandtia nassauensis]|uniref:Uncharacterized protein n=1 Tax=Stackebrandtia nassauensis (strain DSM 44728 / CIP 108903 / NRRL B-16338 / NBRC 102104 / LLR-40K-21) TaxID=446470 RepID=D3Q2G5_STANL|nr:hypothetical protein [Stackebrandtia nassauensis]ADD43898.1 hypothetical protein Snas_4249 [Stackebrandtia nassauensis DSM 44728]